MRGQPTCTVIADDGHRFRRIAYATWYLNVRWARQLETRAQHLRARPLNEALPHGAGEDERSIVQMTHLRENHHRFKHGSYAARRNYVGEIKVIGRT